MGALDDLGGRPALLESMDRILAISSSNFQAADAGQISMFGDGTGLAEAIILPEAKTAINRRAQLDWERELIGLYVSDHPLSTVMDSLEQHVTHFAQDLNEAKDQETGQRRWYCHQDPAASDQKRQSDGLRDH